MRKISLRALDAEIARYAHQRQPLPLEIQLLGGLQRIEYVFVDTVGHDIVLAGPAESWTVDKQGGFVGQLSHTPGLCLDDLIVALRADAAALQAGLSCSLDANPDGIVAYQQFIRSKPQPSVATTAEIKRRVGPYQVTLDRVPVDSHLAAVLVAADVSMKRLGMGLDDSPTKDVPSYLYLLQTSKKRVPMSMPRWWITTNYDSMTRDADNTAWAFRGAGVKTLTEENYISRTGESIPAGKTSKLAEQWSDSFTENYDAVAKSYPALRELQNAMDLVTVATILSQHQLLQRVGLTLTALLDEGMLQPGEMPVPKTTEPQVSYAKTTRSWIVTASGGVEVRAWDLVRAADIDSQPAKAARQNLAHSATRWWWD